MDFNDTLDQIKYALLVYEVSLGPANLISYIVSASSRTNYTVITNRDVLTADVILSNVSFSDKSDVIDDGAAAKMTLYKYTDVKGIQDSISKNTIIIVDNLDHLIDSGLLGILLTSTKSMLIFTSWNTSLNAITVLQQSIPSATVISSSLLPGPELAINFDVKFIQFDEEQRSIYDAQIGEALNDQERSIAANVLYPQDTGDLPDYYVEEGGWIPSDLGEFYAPKLAVVVDNLAALNGPSSKQVVLIHNSIGYFETLLTDAIEVSGNALGASEDTPSEALPLTYTISTSNLCFVRSDIETNFNAQVSGILITNTVPPLSLIRVNYVHLVDEIKLGDITKIISRAARGSGQDTLTLVLYVMLGTIDEKQYEGYVQEINIRNTLYTQLRNQPSKLVNDNGKLLVVTATQ